jgi:hypothetical protein
MEWFLTFPQDFPPKSCSCGKSDAALAVVTFELILTRDWDCVAGRRSYRLEEA